MADPVDAPGTAPVTDRRPVPRGVLPRRVQTWLMAAVAIGMLLIIGLTGRPDSPGVTPTSTAPAQATNPDRVREYQERLRNLDAQAALEARAALAETPLPPSLDQPAPSPARVDPTAADRRRREYESLFASNIVLSRRADAERPDASDPGSPDAGDASPRRAADPSIDDIADAVVRATTRRPTAADAVLESAAAPPVAPAATRPRSVDRSKDGPIRAIGPRHTILEGTVIDTVLTTRLDSSAAAPVNCLVTNPVYSHSGQYVLIPAGARVLGETRAVQTVGETRLAVGFHRLLLPDGSSVDFDQFRGLNQIGESGLRDQVNHHYWSTFGAAAAVGLVGGLAQRLGTAGVGGGTGDRTIILGPATDASAQASLQVLNRFLNRLPTLTIREGHRVKVYVTSDLDLPAWTPPGVGGVERR